MKFSIRKSVHFDSFDKWLPGLEGIPIELAVPHDMQEFWSVIGHLRDLAAYVRDTGLLVNSVHAPHGRLAGSAFMAWAAEVTKFADRVGARFIVFHPEDRIARARKPQLQATALVNIKTLQTRTRAWVAVETFKNKSRMFTPAEIIEHGLPMVLNTSHLPEQDTLELIAQYSGNIVSVHLSENRIDPAYSEKVLNHPQAESYGIKILKVLQDKGWDGTVTLEYLPDYHDRLIPDRQRLQELFR